MFELLEDIQKSLTNLFKTSTENTANHVAKWVSHGRLGGFIKYRQTDFEELRNLNLQYQQYLGKLPSILDIDEQNQVPRAKEHEISACFIYDHYNNRGDLHSIMFFLSNLIKLCVNARFNAATTQGYNHLNGAVILFSAEMALWINTTAKMSIDEQMLKTINTRIHYLDALLENTIFNNEAKTDYAIDLLIFNLNNVLEKLVKPQIQAKLNAQSSRDYFSTLVKESNFFFTHITRGLYCLYSSQNKELSSLFHLEGLNHITHTDFEKSMNTDLGNLFKQLSNTHSPQISDSTTNMLLSFENLTLTTLLLDKSSKNSGIHELIYSQPKLIDHLLTVIKLLKHFLLLIDGFKTSYALAGDGGDILVYIALCQEINTIIACYSLLRDRLQVELMEIYNITNTIASGLIKNQDKSPWRAQYLSFKRDMEQVKEALGSCNVQINNIIIKWKEFLPVITLQKYKVKLLT